MSQSSPPAPNVLIENIEAVSVSSSQVSHRTAHLQRLFSPEKCVFGKIDPSSHLMTLLKDTLEFDDSFITRLEELGLSTPAILVNSFGLDTRSIARTFGLMGSHFVFGDPDTHDVGMFQTQTILLVTFCRTQICSGGFAKRKNKTWVGLKKMPKYSEDFEKWGSSWDEQVKMACTSQDLLYQGHQLMCDVRKLLRKWLRNDVVSDSSTIPDSTTPPQTKAKVAAQSSEDVFTSLKKME